MQVTDDFGTWYGVKQNSLAVCEGSPSLLEAFPLILPAKASGENFPNFTGNLPLLGTCNNCSSPNTTQHFYASNSAGVLTCMNGSNPTQVNWSGFCACELAGSCYRFADANPSIINSAVQVTFDTTSTDCKKQCVAGQF